MKMFKVSIIGFTILIISIYGNSCEENEQISTPTVQFIKTKQTKNYRINPLKLFFNVVYKSDEHPAYSVEWNLPFLKTLFLESQYVSDDEKQIFLNEFSNENDDYGDWSNEKHDQLERFTEKYLNLYDSPTLFLPFIDCTALVYAITDEMLSGIQSQINEEKRLKVRAKAVERLCNFEQKEQ